MTAMTTPATAPSMNADQRTAHRRIITRDLRQAFIDGLSLADAHQFLRDAYAQAQDALPATETSEDAQIERHRRRLRAAAAHFDAQADARSNLVEEIAALVKAGYHQLDGRELAFVYGAINRVWSRQFCHKLINAIRADAGMPTGERT